ncbi:MAG TPA: hypothetical protein VGZ91_15450 [Candidatus Sulfotelmatobacter sp.]|jgi:7,8-dihydro-6-hydroxymethylpterin-pyrophosphokinase|nr:hypothetical protein [Candidatus Sulfotelmatobacter sp.]
MEPILVPRPKSVRDPNRPVSSLLLAQVKHLREAEKELPGKYQSGIFSHAIQTESEAARYVQAVTQAIHAAHDDAAAQRVRKAPKRKRVIDIDIAAVADEGAERRTRSISKRKKKKGKS